VSVHPDLTAHRAVDACGGTYTSSEVDSGYADGHKDALDAACEAVKKPDALMNELLAALEADEELEGLLNEIGDYDVVDRHRGPLVKRLNVIRNQRQAAIAKATGDA
jgi:hypothetical protein